jgi:hypothetical protein
MINYEKQMSGREEWVVERRERWRERSGEQSVPWDKKSMAELFELIQDLLIQIFQLNQLLLSEDEEIRKKDGEQKSWIGNLSYTNSEDGWSKHENCQIRIWKRWIVEAQDNHIEILELTVQNHETTIQFQKVTLQQHSDTIETLQNALSPFVTLQHSLSAC